MGEVLAKADPANAATYRINAAKTRGDLDALTAEIDAKLAPVRGKGYGVYHDAYHYFEHRFNIEASGAVAESEASQPSAARIAEIRKDIAEKGMVCIFTEPQFTPKIVETVIEGTDVRKGVLDPTGSEVEPGPGHYRGMIESLANNLVGCLGS